MNFRVQNKIIRERRLLRRTEFTMITKKRLLALSLVLITLVALSFTRPAERYFEIAKNLDIFATLFKEVNALYVDDVNPNTLIRTGIEAML